MNRSAWGIGSLCLSLCLLISLPVNAQQWLNTDDDTKTNRSSFRQIEDWPDPNDYRNAAGSPGPRYWQQQVDYVIETELDTTNHVVRGSERVTYHNNSPDALRYLWFQLDQNVRSIEHSRTYEAQGALPANVAQIPPQFRQALGFTPEPFDGGFELSKVQVQGPNGQMQDARTLINNTIMKVHLPEPLQPGEQTELELAWHYNILPNGFRGGRELMSDGWVYEITQWFPRLSVYDDVNGWQTDQFLGQGEFYLQFGNYDVKITVPWDHIVDATGELQNPDEVLTRTQRRRLERAYQGKDPVFIIEADEVMTPDSRPTNSGTLTWHFKAENVRDFAWVSSKTYVWDAAGYERPDGSVVALHSLYSRDGMPLWDKVSTKAIWQTMETYGRMSLEYPYPKAINVLGPAFGMEYPMVSLCGSRPQPDGTFSQQTEDVLVLVTIHEVGHNWFPMIVAADERKWAWMDEGINTYLEHYAKLDWNPEFPMTNEPTTITDYMRDPDQVPIMTQSDLIHRQYGNNAYNKPGTGLVLLREFVVGPEAFDEAFREYSEKWAFKHPQPADFFRSMEEAAGEDLSWFWRGWFYTTHANDQSIASVNVQAADSLLGSTQYGAHYYRVEVTNEGGLVMPLVMDVTYDDGSTERLEMPVDIWRNNEKTFTKGFFSDKAVVKVEVDPDASFADIDTNNNVWEAPSVTEEETDEG